MNTMNTPRLMSDTPKTDEFILSCVRTDYNWQILARNLERELNATKQDCADFGALVDKLERELNAAKSVIESLEDALIDISEYWDLDEREASMSDACWHAVGTADKALEKLKEHNK